MTKRITDRPLKSAGAKRKPVPATVPTAKFIEALAASGHTVIGIAAAFGTTKKVLAKWLDENPELEEAFDRGRERERHALHNKLYRQAMSGIWQCSMFLLKARHGYREGDQSDQSNKVSITFTLPGAQPLEQFLEHESSPDALPVSKSSLSRT